MIKKENITKKCYFAGKISDRTSKGEVNFQKIKVIMTPVNTCIFMFLFIHYLFIIYFTLYYTYGVVVHTVHVEINDVLVGTITTQFSTL